MARVGIATGRNLGPGARRRLRPVVSAPLGRVIASHYQVGDQRIDGVWRIEVARDIPAPSHDRGNAILRNGSQRIIVGDILSDVDGKDGTNPGAPRRSA
jgi:hypothetical protein